ncbi:MAG: PD40 domain-containing protein [Candidatus Latescibacterota bacterium]|nr:MAG: PD40 domain-containing protein [Candidatus Latescibacterota bacterium]
MKKSKTMRRIVVIIMCLVAVVPAAAQREVDLEIRTTYANLIPIAVVPFSALDGAKADQATTLEQLVSKDLEFSGVFKITRGRISKAGNGDEDGLVEVRGVLKARGSKTQFEGFVVDASNNLTIGGKRYEIGPGQLRNIAHHFADEVVRMLTGEEGIASTKILYRRTTGKKWELVMSDYDGYNPRVLLRQTVPVLQPRWIDRSKGLVYTNFRGGNADLYLRYLKDPSSKVLLSHRGLNFSVDWSSRRNELLVTLSKDGNPEIYIVNKSGKIKRRLTHNRAIDCSPSWSPSGREVLFTSDRSGSPQVYVMESNGSNVRRLTYFGNYNESPAWSPKGDKIVLVSRIGGFFQLCTIRPDGTGFRPITRESVDHEDPRWAPNGRHVIYTEKRGGEKVISIIDINTGGKRILSQGDTPDWSIR